MAMMEEDHDDGEGSKEVQFFQKMVKTFTEEFKGDDVTEAIPWIMNYLGNNGAPTELM